MTLGQNLELPLISQIETRTVPHQPLTHFEEVRQNNKAMCSGSTLVHQGGLIQNISKQSLSPNTQQRNHQILFSQPSELSAAVKVVAAARQPHGHDAKHRGCRGLPLSRLAPVVKYVVRFTVANHKRPARVVGIRHVQRIGRRSTVFTHLLAEHAQRRETLAVADGALFNGVAARPDLARAALVLGDLVGHLHHISLKSRQPPKQHQNRKEQHSTRTERSTQPKHVLGQPSNTQIEKNKNKPAQAPRALRLETTR